MQDIHGIRPPVPVGIDLSIPQTIGLVLAGIVLLGLVFFLIRRWMKNKTTGRNEISVTPPLPPYEAAMNLLGDLQNRSMDDPRQVYFDLTFIFRDYIGQTYTVQCVEMTSEQFSVCLKTLDLPLDLKNRFLRFQDRCDTIKYAGNHPENQLILKDIEFIKDLIDKIETEKNIRLQKAFDPGEDLNITEDR